MLQPDRVSMGGIRRPIGDDCEPRMPTCARTSESCEEDSAVLTCRHVPFRRRTHLVRASPLHAQQAETRARGCSAASGRGDAEPYRLRAVGHSLGGASLLIYVVMCRKLNLPHHLYRLILLTPAGFMHKAPLVRTAGRGALFSLRPPSRTPPPPIFFGGGGA
jgi:hypothetical protein